VEKRLDQMRWMLEKKDLTIEELRSRLNRAIVADEGANVSCDQVEHKLFPICPQKYNYSSFTNEHTYH